MGKEMSALAKTKLWYDMNKSFIHIVLIFLVILVAGIVFTNFRSTQNEQVQDISMYTESTKLTSVDYEKIFGYAPLDSTVPPITGIKTSYTYQVNKKNFTGKQTFYKRGFKEIMNGINNAPETLEVRYKSNHPEESVITIKEK